MFSFNVRTLKPIICYIQENASFYQRIVDEIKINFNNNLCNTIENTTQDMEIQLTNSYNRLMIDSLDEVG